MNAAEYAGAHGPYQFAGEIVCSNEHLLVIEETDIDALSIGRWRARGVTVEFVDPVQGRGQYLRLPQLATAVAIQR